MTGQYAAWQFWFNVFQSGGLLILGIYTWWTNREKITSRRFHHLEKEVAERVTAEALAALDEKRDDRCRRHINRTGKLEVSFSRIDAEVKGLPGRQSLDAVHGRVDEVHGRVTAVQGQLEKISGRLEGIGHTVNLIQEHLLKSKGAET